MHNVGLDPVGFDHSQNNLTEITCPVMKCVDLYLFTHLFVRFFFNYHAMH